MMDLLEKPAEMMPPHSIEAEQCLLASLMVCNGDPVVYAEVAGVIREESFFQTDHAIIYAALQDMHRKERKVDPVVLRDELRRRGVLEEVGGAAYLAQIINTPCRVGCTTPSTRTQVREKAALRDLIVLCGHTAQACYRPQREDVAGKLASKLSHGATDIAVRGSTAELKPLGEILVEIAHRKPDEVRRLMTGMYEIDDATGGIGCGEFSLVGGRPGMGKSAFIKQVILNMARAGVTCGVVSIEESNNKIGENVLANLSGVENNRIAYSRLSPVEEQSLQTVAPGQSLAPGVRGRRVDEDGRDRGQHNQDGDEARLQVHCGRLSPADRHWRRRERNTGSHADQQGLEGAIQAPERRQPRGPASSTAAVRAQRFDYRP